MSRDFPITHFFLSILFSAILIGLSINHKAYFITTPANFVLKPLRTPFVSLNYFFNNTADALRQFPYQTRLIKDLERQNAALSTTAKRVEELQKENQALRQQTNSPLPKNYHLLPTKIIGISRFAYLNQGSSNGVKPNQVAVVDNVYVGQIISTSATTSKLRLLNDPDTKLTVSINNTFGQLSFSDTTLRIDQILQKDPIDLQNPVYTKGTDIIPDNLLIGIISQINDNPASVYKSAFVKPSFSVTDQQTVFIVLEE